MKKTIDIAHKRENVTCRWGGPIGGGMPPGGGMGGMLWSKGGRANGGRGGGPLIIPKGGGGGLRSGGGPRNTWVWVGAGAGAGAGAGPRNRTACCAILVQQDKTRLFSGRAARHFHRNLVQGVIISNCPRKLQITNAERKPS